MSHQMALKTVVFVDYECWRFALSNQYDNLEPDVKDWFQKVKTKGQIEDLFIFGDFNNNLLCKDQAKLRTLTSNIINTSNEDNKKDYTDFIILDHIYQTLIKNDTISQYIIFSGDGHFSSVAAFLKNFRDKVVGIYAVEGTLSPQLKDSASWTELITPSEQFNSKIVNLILGNLHWVESQDRLIPSFRKTADIVAKNNNLTLTGVSVVLKRLISQGYITQCIKLSDNGNEINALIVNWELLEHDGIWNPNEE